MSNDVLSSSADGAEWDKSWEVVSRLVTSRSQLARDTDEIARAAAALRESDPGTWEMPADAAPKYRRHSVWILIGALWISMGLIISATIVAIAFLL